ncbi:nucleotidyltransferase family protein [Roseicitreum antarcticum]|uniref:CTP:molybdopterin cytidylyltransferase MocA n=1 Tax=Roseicitreum antarcticum TaxID=564137 RepID=A0A1H3CF56_9RHOB|nr:nucleotidyltransferase family protein [Roseicitreum antarcticum]SDX52763.1 CTP:molybdopterin cytidylyltransferase MocA [Roseicitreum antarcticum]
MHAEDALPVIALPAAGASSRMGGNDKLLMDVEGQPLLRHAARAALAVGYPVAVTLRPDDAARRAALSGLPVHVLPVADADAGMSGSIRAAASWAQGLGASALMVHLPDMPDITGDDIKALIEDHASTPAMVLRAASAEGAAGNPVILPSSLFAALQGVQGDTGARAALRGHPVRLHPLTGARALTDLDTPEAWADWRAARKAGRTGTS